MGKSHEELSELKNSESDEIKEALDYFTRYTEMREIALLEERSALSFAENKGIEKGRQEMIEAMRARGLNDNDIEEIIKLREKSKDDDAGV